MRICWYLSYQVVQESRNLFWNFFSSFSFSLFQPYVLLVILLPPTTERLFEFGLCNKEEENRRGISKTSLMFGIWPTC